MILSNVNILNELQEGRLVIWPSDIRSLQPASYDLHLNQRIIVDRCGGGMSFALGSTLEYVEIPANILGQVHGISTLGRKGIIPHCAGLIDPGFRGHITLEIVNFMPYAQVLEAGERVAQITFEYTHLPANPAYNGRYQDQSADPTPARPDKQPHQQS